MGYLVPETALLAAIINSSTSSHIQSSTHLTKSSFVISLSYPMFFGPQSPLSHLEEEVAPFTIQRRSERSEISALRRAGVTGRHSHRKCRPLPWWFFVVTCTWPCWLWEGWKDGKRRRERERYADSLMRRDV